MSTEHLGRLAQKLAAEGAVGISRNLSAAAREGATSRGLDLPSCLKNSCEACGSVFVPGHTSRVRIVPLHRRRRQSKKSSGLEPKNTVVTTCLVCGAKSRGLGSDPVKITKASSAKETKKRPLHPRPPPKAATTKARSNAQASGFISLSEPKRRRKKKPLEAPAPVSKPPSAFQRFVHCVNK